MRRGGGEVEWVGMLLIFFRGDGRRRQVKPAGGWAVAACRGTSASSDPQAAPADLG